MIKISSNSATKQRHKDYVKARIEKTQEIADVDYVVIKTKQSITYQANAIKLAPSQLSGEGDPWRIVLKI